MKVKSGEDLCLCVGVGGVSEFGLVAAEFCRGPRVRSMLTFFIFNIKFLVKNEITLQAEQLNVSSELDTFASLVHYQALNTV